MKDVLNTVCNTLREKSYENFPMKEGDYYEGDILFCGECHTPKEMVLKEFFEGKKVRIPCEHIKAQKVAERAKEEAAELARYAEETRRKAFPSERMMQYRFENDDGTNLKLTNALKTYAKDFRKYRDEGMGLLLYGSCGTGKTFSACQTANALIDAGFTVKFTTFSDIKAQLLATYDKEEIYHALNSCHLLVIDDMGIEGNGNFTKETVYKVINDRYQLGRPMLITTNLSMDEMLKPNSEIDARIFDRVLEICHPIKVEGATKRIPKARERYKEMKAELGL